MTPNDLRTLIRTQLPDAEVHCEDLTGTGDHWQATVISSAFAGQRLLKQHRMVNEACREALADRSIHALSLKTFTPEQWAARNEPNP